MVFLGIVLWPGQLDVRDSLRGVRIVLQPTKARIDPNCKRMVLAVLYVDIEQPIRDPDR